MLISTVYDAFHSSRRRFLKHGPCGVAALAVLFEGATQAAPSPLVVLAASDLSSALPKIIALFEARTGQPARLVLGSSGQFTRQIREGLPFDLFCSADIALLDQLALEGKVKGKAQPMGRGRLALASRSDLLSGPGEKANSVTTAMVAARLAKSRKLAIANPNHAPYGRAAKETLVHLGLWDTVQSKLVLAESAAQASQFVLQGAAQMALVPVALMPPPNRHVSQWERKAGDLSFTVQLIPSNFHQPLLQGVGLSVQAGPQAQQLLDHLLSPTAQMILQAHGFDSVAGT